MESKPSALLRIDNITVVVEDLPTAIAFFTELGLELEGETTVEGPLVDRIVGLEGVRSDIALMRTPDGDCKLELTKFHRPKAISAQPNAPVNTLGIGRIMFAVEGIEEVLGRLRNHGAELVGEVTNYEGVYRLCYIRGPEGILIALAEEL
jgi:catechol 2,3-dioxygenase-like lactoylglutathione lyase family enzyme